MKLGIGVNLFKRQEQKGIPVRDGLVAEYRFDEGRGQVLCDYSGKGNHGRLGSSRLADTNDPLWTPEGLQFDGVDDYVSLGTVLRSMPTTEMTVGAIWKYTPAYEDGLIVPDEGDIFGSYNVESQPFGLFIKIDSFRKLNIGGSISRGYIYYMDRLAEDFNFTVYHSSVLTYIKGISSAFYIDGTYIAPLDVLPDIIIPTAKDIRFGCNLPDRDYAVFKGNIAFAYIYNRALSPEEVLQNHEWSKVELAKRGVILE